MTSSKSKKMIGGFMFFHLAGEQGTPFSYGQGDLTMTL
jgi:hypothetical protein